MAESVHVDCSAPPGPYEPDNDISGAGIVVSYISTAALAVLIIIVYYLTVYDPWVDPFENADPDAAQEGLMWDQINPLDDFILGLLRSGPAYISKRVLDSRKLLSPRARSRLERVLIKCLLVMSDLQIVTGFAILLSGFTQLESGLEALKWRTILDLAWFSCLTHLSCLTMLRRHLHQHAIERVWRLVAMGVLAALLAAGLIPTANPKWVLLSEDTKATPAICILGCYLTPGPDKEWAETTVFHADRDDWDPSQWFWPPIVSAIFVVVAFVSRVVRLHRSLSLGVNRATRWLDDQLQRLLWLLFRNFCKEGEIYSFKRSLAYRPVFGMVMIWRFMLVSCASFALEATWVLIAFIWGIWRLMLDLSPGNSIIPLDFGKQAWSFGQIVPVLMLAAPLISIAETFKEHPGEETSVPRELSDGHLSSRLPLSSAGYSTSEDPERPDSGWASHSSCLGTATTYICVTCIYMGVFVFARSSEGTAPLNTIRQLGMLIAVAIYYFYCIVLSYTDPLDGASVDTRN
ncbi:hypothetical protein N7516_010427 [Penicillium verrucosum]|uniref:uncharacterized protein n=1 Tax=Penicillium verrucosum TaxID=60171 RepID=UPI002545B690|nr:uncharacterized protein N7516_010427 [Penicillium verrucosum]KAJ5922724.1 hypothetical protein N7516_010427 [Penicillium verrucosum]